MDGALLNLLRPQRPSGVVVAATGSGNTSAELLDAARELMADGTIVALTTRCPAGSVAPDYAFPGGGATWQQAGALMSRRDGPKTRVALALGLAAGLDRDALAAAALGVTAAADLVIVGRVATLAGDSGLGWQGGVAIAGGRVLAVGSESELEALIGPRTERWRLDDDLAVLPGITDAHLHLMTVVLAETQIDLTGLDLPATLEAIRAEHLGPAWQGRFASGWLLGHGWSVHHLGGWPDAEQLERVAPGRPVALYAHDHHSRWVSQAAIRLAEIDGDRGRAAGELVRRDATGAPTRRAARGRQLARRLGDPRSDARRARRRPAARLPRRLAALGVTGCHDPGELTSGTEMKRGPLFYRALAEADELPLRVHALAPRARARRRNRAWPAPAANRSAVSRWAG